MVKPQVSRSAPQHLLGWNPPVGKLHITAWLEPSRCQAGHCRVAGTFPSSSWRLPRGWNLPVAKLDTAACPEPSRHQAVHYCMAGTLPLPSWTLPLGRNPPVTKLDTTARPKPSRHQAGHCHLARTLPSPRWTLLYTLLSHCHQGRCCWTCIGYVYTMSCNLQ